MLCIETVDGRLGGGRTDCGGVFAAKPLLQYCTIKQPSAAELLVFMDAITALRITGQSRSSGHITVRDDPARSLALRPAITITNTLRSHLSFRILLRVGINQKQDFYIGSEIFHFRQWNSQWPMETESGSFVQIQFIRSNTEIWTCFPKKGERRTLPLCYPELLGL